MYLMCYTSICISVVTPKSGGIKNTFKKSNKLNRNQTVCVGPIRNHVKLFQTYLKFNLYKLFVHLRTFTHTA